MSTIMFQQLSEVTEEEHYTWTDICDHMDHLITMNMIIQYYIHLGAFARVLV